MKTSFLSQLCFLLCLATFAGCGSGGTYVPVSGTVTLNDKPAANVRVVFSPKPTADSTNTGPPSWGVTDEAGRYELKTKGGDEGVVVGAHSISFKYFDLENLKELKTMLGQAETKAEFADARKRIAHVEKELGIRGEIPDSAGRVFEVPAGGKSDADFELAQ